VPQLSFMTDIDRFATEIRTLRRAALAGIGRADYLHMRAIETAGRLLFLAGLGACWLGWLLPATLALALALMVKWLLMHHIGHGGYDRIAGIPRRYHSTRYALGWRRVIDWFDWILPAAWNHEHNHLHHSFTGEEQDPDLVERNLDWLAQARWPKAVKLLVLAFFAATWKFSYYSARTLSCLKGEQVVDFSNFWDLRGRTQRRLWFGLFLPYAGLNFVLLPLVLEQVASGFGLNWLICRAAAEVLHNVHTFVVIVPNHAGADLHRFDSIDKAQRGGAGFFVRQVLGSANYRTGSEWLDFAQMYLNYQIEHHLMPNLSMLAYRRVQPEVRAICLRHGLPYVQESVGRRLVKMVQIAIGSRQMIRSEALPPAGLSTG